MRYAQFLHEASEEATEFGPSLFIYLSCVLHPVNPCHDFVLRQCSSFCTPDCPLYIADLPAYGIYTVSPVHIPTSQSAMEITLDLPHSMEGFDPPGGSLVRQIERITTRKTRELARTYLRVLHEYTHDDPGSLPPKPEPICAFLASEQCVAPSCSLLLNS